MNMRDGFMRNAQTETKLWIAAIGPSGWILLAAALSMVAGSLLALYL